tara:strand:+ start:583 stop:798 length:216 start_codon:yes stop_codon:yes gene_type:complete
MRKLSQVVTFLLLIGIVDQINDDIAIVEYTHQGIVKHTKVSLDLSACKPVEGQTVYFYKDYKIVTCEEKVN